MRIRGAFQTGKGFVMLSLLTFVIVVVSEVAADMDSCVDVSTCTCSLMNMCWG